MEFRPLREFSRKLQVAGGAQRHGGPVAFDGVDGEIRDRGENRGVVFLEGIDFAPLGRDDEVPGVVGEAERLPRPAVLYARTPEEAFAMDDPGAQRVGVLRVFKAHQLAEAVVAGDDDRPAAVEIAFDCGARRLVLPVPALGLAGDLLAVVDDRVFRELLRRQPLVGKCFVDVAVGLHDVAHDGVNVGSVAANRRRLCFAENKKGNRGQGRVAECQFAHGLYFVKKPCALSSHLRTLASESGRNGRLRLEAEEEATAARERKVELDADRCPGAGRWV